jgi:hypothetical protein
MTPEASRPYMPGYGIVGPGDGRGLLPWSWAEERLVASHDYWVATVTPDGRPHVMPVWGVWAATAFWFSSASRSRKARNLAGNPAVTVTTDNALQPVVVEGRAEPVTGRPRVREFTDRANEKYGTDYSVEFFAGNALFRVRPRWAFALDEGDFTGTPTRWVFSGA